MNTENTQNKMINTKNKLLNFSLTRSKTIWVNAVKRGIRKNIKVWFLVNSWCKINEKVNKNNLVYSIGSLVAGESIKSKIKRLKKIIENEKIDNLFISSGENVCWLLNIRGKDLPNSPIANFQAIITKKKEIILFGNIKKLKNISKKFIKEKISFFENYKFFEIFNKIFLFKIRNIK